MKRTLLLLLFGLLVSLSNYTAWGQTINYHSGDSINIYSIDLKQVSDSLIGNHCFTAYRGSKIDCCLDKTDGKSLYLKKQSANNYLGLMKSCYDYKLYHVSISFINDTLLFILKDDTHEFLEKDKKVFFIKSKH